jgi:peptidoglycan/xylan/chitin deacetylase (PgdA/CDA1 family)
MGFLKSTFTTGLLSALVAASPLSVEKRQSSLPYGVVIYSCTVPDTFALAFDDGPYLYTVSWLHVSHCETSNTSGQSSLLDQLEANGMKGTFFMNGQNYGSIYDYSAVVQRMVNDGHQVASHT